MPQSAPVNPTPHSQENTVGKTFSQFAKFSQGILEQGFASDSQNLPVNPGSQEHSNKPVSGSVQ
jgi:hypothetical protein